FVSLRTMDDDAQVKGVMADCLSVIQTTPELVSSAIWLELDRLCYVAHNTPVYSPLSKSHLTQWHKYNPVPGTCYDPDPRLDYPALLNQPNSVDLVEKMYLRAPYDRGVSTRFDWLKYRGKGTFEQDKAIYRSLLEYDPFVMIFASEKVADKP